LHNEKKKKPTPAKDDIEQRKAAKARKQKLNELKERDLEQDIDNDPYWSLTI
jgi:hypothetical protein